VIKKTYQEAQEEVKSKQDQFQEMAINLELLKIEVSFLKNHENLSLEDQKKLGEKRDEILDG